MTAGDKIKIVGRHIEITDSLANYVKKRFNNVDKYVHKIISFQVILEKEKYRHSIEVILHNNRRKIFRIKETDENIYTAIDKSADRLKDILSRYKQKVVSSRKHRQKASKIFPVEEVGVTEYSVTEYIVPQMSFQEAIKKFSPEKENFFIFFSPEKNKNYIIFTENNELKISELIFPEKNEN